MLLRFIPPELAPDMRSLRNTFESDGTMADVPTCRAAIKKLFVRARDPSKPSPEVLTGVTRCAVERSGSIPASKPQHDTNYDEP